MAAKLRAGSCRASLLRAKWSESGSLPRQHTGSAPAAAASVTNRQSGVLEPISWPVDDGRHHPNLAWTQLRRVRRGGVVHGSGQGARDTMALWPHVVRRVQPQLRRFAQVCLSARHSRPATMQPGLILASFTSCAHTSIGCPPSNSSVHVACSLGLSHTPFCPAEPHSMQRSAGPWPACRQRAAHLHIT